MLLKNYLETENLEKAATREGYGKALLKLGEKDPRVVVLTADLAESTRVLPFAEKFPERFVEVGVAEQNMMGIAAGLALSGKIPFVSSYAVFSPGRSWDQLRVSVCYSQANVKIIGAHTGLSVGPDGATHQALEDLAIVRCLPNIQVISPHDSTQAHTAVEYAAAHDGPVYIRLAREKTPIFTDGDFQIGKSEVLVEGTDMTIVAHGPLVYEALKASAVLGEKLSVEVISATSIKPLGAKEILESARKTGLVVTLEEHQLIGGLGSAVCELLSEKGGFPVYRLGMQDQFGQSGSYAELLSHYRLDAKNLAEILPKLLKKNEA